MNPSLAYGEIRYEVALSAGSIPTGEVRVNGTDGADIGAFQATMSVPPPIQIVTPLAPGAVILNTQPFRVTWTNGSADATVRVWLVAPSPLGTEANCQCAAPASEGEVTLDLAEIMGKRQLPVPPNEDAQVVITVAPRAGLASSFSAPGLTRQGTQDWGFEYRFTGLKIRLPQ